jgi:thioesterase domain-containing protein
VNCYLPLARALGKERPFYAIQSHGMEEGQQPLECIEEMAALYIKEMRKAQPSGPYQIGGFCLGGSIAYEMAQQLQEAGEEVSLLVLMEEVAHFAIIDAPVTKEEVDRLIRRYVHHGLSRLYPVKMRISGAYLAPQYDLSLEEQIALLAAHEKKSDALPQDTTPEQLHRYFRVWATNLAAKKRYRLRPYSGRTVLLRADPPTRPDPFYGWGRLAEGLSVHCFKNTRHSDFVEPEKNARQLAAVIEQYMEESVGRAGESMPVAVQALGA